MQVFSAWSERQAHITRWVLLLGWLMLILSLLLGLDPYPFDVNRCAGSPDCHAHEGNQLFWGMVVPACLFILVVFSHEVWRRICPLAFVSQLFRSLGWQRTVAGKGGRREVVKVEADSWLGRHHVQLQWSLLIGGLCLRILVVNSSTIGLGLLLVCTLLAALLVGWAYGGKAWCHYFCPMAPVQSVVTGPRSFFGSPAHGEINSRITQSMCRTIGEDGRIQSACVACQAPCVDIDSERSYWQTLSGKRGLTWAWWSYPGLVFGFFLLLKDESRGGLDYLRSGMWAYDKELLHYIWQPLCDGTWTLGLPRLVSIPFLLVLSGWISYWFFSWWQQLQQHQLTREFGARSAEVSMSHTRLLATFVAVNGFFWFADPSLGLIGPAGGQGIRSLVLIVSGMWLHRGWHRDRAAYIRESTSSSLRKQLQKLIPDLSPYLDGRTLPELSAGEVFTLAKVLPAQISETKRSIYKGVMFDLFSTGRLERATALVKLEELRNSLGLLEEDHFATIREIAIEDPRILELNSFQLEIRSLRQEAAREAIEELMKVTRSLDLHAALARPHLRERLERIRTESALDEPSWEALLGHFGPASAYARQRLDAELDMLSHQLESRRALELAAATDPRFTPLLLVMDRRITSLQVTIGQALQGFDAEEPRRRHLAVLQLQFPASVWRQVRRGEQGLAPAMGEGTPALLGPLPDPAAVLDQLWQDPDPDTALWALWLQLHRSPERGAALRRQPRLGLPSSPALDRVLMGEEMEGADLVERLLRVPLVARMSPAALFSLVHWGERRSWAPGQPLFPQGDPPGSVAILLEGNCEVWREGGDGQPSAPIATICAGEPIGEVSFFTDRLRQVHIQAGREPVLALMFSGAHFERLLEQSSEFSHGLLHQLAMKIEGMYGGLGRDGEPGSHSRVPPPAVQP
jgi:hypothetical protein